MKLIINLMLSEGVSNLGKTLPGYLEDFVPHTLNMIKQVNDSGDDISREDVRHRILYAINSELVSHFPKKEFEYQCFLYSRTDIELHIVIDVRPDHLFKYEIDKFTYFTYQMNWQRH